MPKRSRSPLSTPAKLTKANHLLPISPLTSNMDGSVRLLERTVGNRPSFKYASAGPETCVKQSYVLSYKPKLEASINLNGNLPEIKLTNPNSTIRISGGEFLEIANCSEDWTSKHLFLADFRLEPFKDGSVRFARYEKNLHGDVSQRPLDVFDMSTFEVNRLKSKMDEMSEHVFSLMENETAINQMFNCIVSTYKSEYAKLASTRPIEAHFDELSRVIEAHTPFSHMVKDFLLNSTYCSFNYHSLLASALTQKTYLKSML